MNWQAHITSDKNILLGKPCIKGTKISIELILELMSDGWSEAMILESYSTISVEDLKAVFAYLKECIGREFYFPTQRLAS